MFNRGNFSSGHLLDKPNKELIFPQKPNNMGIFLGKISKYNKSKGHITAKLEHKLCIGDNISFDSEPTKYTISELMENNQNIRTGLKQHIVTFGRMKGNIKVGDNIYKIASKELSDKALESFSKEYKKTYLYCKLNIN